VSVAIDAAGCDHARGSGRADMKNRLGGILVLLVIVGGLNLASYVFGWGWVFY